VPEVTRNFGHRDEFVRMTALWAWAAAVEANPSSDEIIAHLSEVAKLFSDRNDGVRDAALSVWELVGKARPDHPLIVGGTEAFNEAEGKRTIRL